MVFVRVRETYDLCTVKGKMTVISIHTPKPDIIKKNYPGLLMQCRAYRPVSADVRVACASMQPLDPQGIGLSDGDVAPEDVFNPILYKAMSNKGMSQLEARVNRLNAFAGTPGSPIDVDGSTAAVEVDDFTSQADEFALYYGLLSNTNDWKHANPQAGLSMTGLRPLVYEKVWNVGDSNGMSTGPGAYQSPDEDGLRELIVPQGIIGKAKEMPFINCTSYSVKTATKDLEGLADSGFKDSPANCSVDVPWINVVCGCIIVPPSRLHQLFYRMVVEWTIEFSQLRPVGEITDWNALGGVGAATHYQNYSYESTKAAITGSADSILDKDSCMVSSNVDVKKVM